MVVFCKEEVHGKIAIGTGAIENLRMEEQIIFQ